MCVRHCIGVEQVCEMALGKGFTRVFDQETKTPYAYKDNQWITYDDVTSLQYKVRGVNVTVLSHPSIRQNGSACATALWRTSPR